MEPAGIAIAAAAAFACTLLVLPLWIRHKDRHRLLGRDMHKAGKPLIAEQGGIVVALGVLVGILAFVAYDVFVRQNPAPALLLAALLSFAIAAVIGFIDGVLGWRTGLKQSHKLLLSALIPLPLMALNAGTHSMHLPFIGGIELGPAYALIVIPIGIIGAANGFNMLAGYNGLEAGMGAIILGTLSFIAWTQGSAEGVLLGITATLALLAFLRFNIYPARVFPGDSLTYGVGTLAAAIAIIANIELYAVILFIPYFAEFILKARAGFTPGTSARWLSIARVLPDGSLSAGNRWCTLPHAAIAALRKTSGRATEAQITLFLWVTEAALAAAAIAILLQ